METTVPTSRIQDRFADAAGRKKASKKPDELKLLGVDVELGLYELTDLFHAFYEYHDNDCMVDYQQVTDYNPETKLATTTTKALSRFQALRRIEAARLGSRPFLSNKGVAKHKPNVSFGYMRLMLDYLALPYKSMFTDSDIVKVRINQKHYQKSKLSDDENDVIQMQSKSNPTISNNKEISDDVSDAYADIMRRSKKINKSFDTLPRRVAQDGVVAFVHSDIDWTPETVQALDLVTEPQAECDPEGWNTFFVIRKMTAQEAVKHIRDNTTFWNSDALRWALESSRDEKGLLNGRHYNHRSDDAGKVAGENFAVKSFYAEKSTRQTNVGSYYGNMLVVEGYYTNTTGKVNKVIFFPSSEFSNISTEDRDTRKAYLAGTLTDKEAKAVGDIAHLEFADVLFYRQDVFDSMEDAITVIPSDRSEPSLERQRAYGHELFSPIEMVMRIDSAILNIAMLMGVLFYKNRNEGNTAQDLLDLEIKVSGELQDIGERELIASPFTGDLNSMTAVRSMLLQHIASKAYLGGLDGAESLQNGRGANLANLRLIRDGRVHKHTTEEVSKGLTDLFTKMFRTILELKDKDLIEDDVLLKKTFFEVLTLVHGHPDGIFEFDKEDVVPDTGLPYWMEVEAVRNGASHFGAAELVLYSEIKQVFGDGLDQNALQALNRMGVKSLLGQQDALDILGDPKENIVTSQDQLYRARMENAAVLGSVDQGSLNFEPVMVLSDKDDHVLHLTQVHLPKADEILKRLQENEVTPTSLAEVSEQELESRNNLILKLGALANHIQLHAQNLDRFGSQREDVNQVKEQANIILQSSEGLMNNLQQNLRALEEKRAEAAAKLQNLSPENEAEKATAEVEMQKLQASAEDAKGKLMLANKIADQSQQQHIDQQLTKARDRRQRDRLADKAAEVKREEIQTKRSVELAKAKSTSSSDK